MKSLKYGKKMLKKANNGRKVGSRGWIAITRLLDYEIRNALDTAFTQAGGTFYK